MEKFYDLVIVGGTPAGLMAAIAAARNGKTSLILERTLHIGGLPANGLGATDIGTRGGTGGLFLDFVGRIKNYYVGRFGEKSEQAKICSDGYHFEPHVAELILEQMIAEFSDKITVLKRRQFDALPSNVEKTNNQAGLSGSPRNILSINVTNRENGKNETYRGSMFVDATYEGDLAAAAGVPFRIGREASDEFAEPFAGKLYVPWWGEIQKGSSGLGDNAIQAYNYRMCLTDAENNRAPIEKPKGYNREKYVSLIEDVRLGRWSGKPGRELFLDGIGRISNIVLLPNGKTDANNQHLALISTDLPEENWPWPMAGWEWRDRFADSLRDYILGLIWFSQNDPDLPEAFRRECLKWGLAKDEYQDNQSFPRQVYVREGRRIEGMHLFTAHDALQPEGKSRPPVHPNSITASHYSLDSHAVLKREGDRDALEGFFNHKTLPYTVPYGVITPKHVTNLSVPVAVSGTHIGFSTLRMEPCWMALGEAAGEACCIAINKNLPLQSIPTASLQKHLLDRGAVLIYFKDLPLSHPQQKAFQYFALKKWFETDTWNANIDSPPSREELLKWKDLAETDGIGHISERFDLDQSRGWNLLAAYDATI